MAKSKYTPQNLKSTMEREILIKVDYEGVGDIEEFVKVNKTHFNLFLRYNKLTRNEVEIKVTPQYIRDRNIPMPEPTIQIVHHFFKNREGEENVVMDVCDTTAYIQIRLPAGKSSRGMEPYSKLMAEFIKKLLSSDSFIHVTRIGMRKKNFYYIKENENVSDVLERDIWTQYADVNNGILPTRKVYADFMTVEASKVNLNFQQIAEKVEKIDTKEKFIRIIVDSDAYLDQNRLDQLDLKNDTVTKNLLQNDMNELLFKFYVEAYKETFLDQYYKP